MWLADKFMILLDDLLSGAVDDEVHLDLASQRDVAERGGLVVVVEPDDGCLCIGISKEHAHVPLWLARLNKQEGVDTVLAAAATARV